MKFLTPQDRRIVMILCAIVWSIVKITVEHRLTSALRLAESDVRIAELDEAMRADAR